MDLKMPLSLDYGTMKKELCWKDNENYESNPKNQTTLQSMMNVKLIHTKVLTLP